MNRKNRLLDWMLIASLGVSSVSLAGCGPSSSPISDISESSLDQYTSAPFDDIYGLKYAGYSIEYEGIPSKVGYEPLDNYSPLLSIIFKDEMGAREFYAYCSDGCDYRDRASLAKLFLDQAQEEKLPIRVYGNQDGRGIKISSFSFLVGPGNWDNIQVEVQITHKYSTPQPSQSGGGE